MKKNLPSVSESVEVLQAKQDAKDTVTGLIERNMELEEIFQNLQPLLYTLSVALYGEDASDVSLAKLVADSVELIAGHQGEKIQ